MADRQGAPEARLSLAGHELLLSLGGGLVFLLLAGGLLGALHWDNRQHHERRRERIEACRSVEDPHARAMCVVALER